MNLEAFTEKELLELKEKIDIKLYSKNDFWNAITTINDLENKSYEVNEKILSIKDKQPQLKRLADLGFSLVIYEIDKIGLILYDEEKVNQKFVGCSFNQFDNKLNFENYEKPIQPKIDELKKIFSINNGENNDELHSDNCILNQVNNSFLNTQ
jgi:hypothetical protein